jgi:nucleoside triphosphate pyrophosphatase
MRAVSRPDHKSQITNHKSRQPANNIHIVLASTSPRRAEILSTLAIPFVVDAPEIDESARNRETAAQAALRLAREKAVRVASRHPEHWVLGADTLVVLDGAMLGKPADAQDARRMLAILSGREHVVVTGVALVRQGRDDRGLVEESRVRMADMSPEEIRWYVETGEPLDKAGAYAVQGLGARFIEGVAGSYTNVMGLPAHAVYRLMREAGDPALALLALSCP